MFFLLKKAIFPKKNPLYKYRDIKGIKFKGRIYYGSRT